MKEKIKVIAYIFRLKNNLKELLVFSHKDYPEAGIQVIGGTVEEGEALLPALVREILEESGLIVSEDQFLKIGVTKYQRSDIFEINHRHYYEMVAKDLPDSWTHIVQSDGADNGLLFDFYWLTQQAAKDCLVGNFGELL